VERPEVIRPARGLEVPEVPDMPEVPETGSGSQKPEVEAEN
jgi:hypothetical protein